MIKRRSLARSLRSLKTPRCRDTKIAKNSLNHERHEYPRMPLIPLGNCFVQSTSFTHASIRVIRSIRAIRDTSCRSSCCRFPSRSLRLCERQKPFSPPFSLCSLKTRSQLSASNVPSSAFTVPRLVSPSLREAPYSLPFLQLPTRNSEEPEKGLSAVAAA